MAASVQIPVTQTGLEASIQAALRNAGKGAQINLGANSRQINALAQPLGRITGQADEFTKSMEAANARVFAFGASVGIINGVSSAFSSLVKNTIAVEKSLTEINSVFQKSSSELEKFGNSLFDVAKNTGQSFDAVAKGALELARQGLSTEESLRRINDALILTRLSGLDAERSVSGLTAAVNAFKSTGITTSEVLNKLVTVSQKYSVSEKDLIEGLKRSSSVAKQAGVSFDELVGIITAVQEKTSVGGAVIGNSFKTIFTRLQRTDTLDALQQLGVSVTDVQGRILPATKLLENLAGTIKSLNQVQLAEITEKVGGGFQIDKLLATLEDLSSQSSVAFKATEISLKSTNQAYEKNAALNVTLAALIDKTSLSAEQLGATLGKIGITDSAKSLLGFFNGLLEGIQKILGEESALGDVFRGLAKGIGNLVTGPGLALFAAIILKLSKDLAQFGFSSLKGFFGIGKAAKEIQNVEQSIAAALSKNIGLQRQLFALEGNRAAQIKLMSDAIVLQEASMRRMASTASALAAPLYGQGVRSSGEGLRVPKAAGGYMPAVSQESSDIRKGVGGARSGDRPVVIPNFAFGGGKRGAMVAHTGEYIVPNFANGGSAIFNRNMVQSMGLPSGAKKINAAGGFVPNFSSTPTLSNEEIRSLHGELKGDFSSLYRKDRATGNPLTTIEYNGKTASKAQIEKALSLNLKTAKFANVWNAETAPSSVMLLPNAVSGMNFSHMFKEPYPDKNGYDSFVGKAYGIDPNLSKDPEFQKLLKLDSIMDESLANAANFVLQQVKPNIHPDPESVNSSNIKNLINAAGGAGALGSIRGALFEAVTNSIVKGISKESVEPGGNNTLDVAFGAKGGEKRKTLEQIFGLKSNHYDFADYKNSLEQKDKYVRQVIDNLWTVKKSKVARASKGFVPNFSDPIGQAVNREMAAGVPASQIYIDKNSSLKNAANPMGLMVANRRDEPAGGYQGINRAIKEGRNPKTYGAANGFVPNYASIVPSVSKEVGVAINAGAGADAINKFASDAMKAGADLKKLSEVLEKEIENITKDAQLAKKIADASEKEISVRLESLRATQESRAVKVLEIQSNKKLAKQLDKIYLEYNKSQKSASDLTQAQKKAADVLKRTSLGGMSQRAIVNSTESLAASRTGAQPGQQKDMLGTIFALQGAFSVLTGYTDNLSGGMGTVVKELGNLGSGLSTAAFAFSGAKDVASGAKGALGKFVGNLGMAGALALGAFEAFKFGKELYNEFSGANKRAADSSLILATAAEKAAFSLDQYSSQNKESIKKTADAIMKGLNLQGVSEPEKKQIEQGILSTLGAGVSISKIQESLNTTTQKVKGEKKGYMTQGGYVEVIGEDYRTLNNGDSQGVVQGLANLQTSGDAIALSKLQSYILEGLDPEAISKMTGLESLGMGVGKSTGASRIAELTQNPEQIQKAIDAAKSANPSGNELASIFNVEDVNWPVVIEFLDKIKKKREEDIATQEKAATETTKQFNIDTSRFRAAQDFEKKMKTFKEQSFAQEMSRKEAIFAIEQNTNLSEDEKQKQINATNAGYEMRLNALKATEEQQRNLNQAISESLSGAMVSDKSVLNAENFEKLAQSFATLDFNNLEPEKITEMLKSYGIVGDGLTEKLIPALQEALVKNKDITEEQKKQIQSSIIQLGIDQKRIDLATAQALVQAKISNKIEARQSTQLYQQELLSLDNSARMLSINQEIEKVKSDYTLTEYEAAKKIVELEKQKKALSEEGINLGSDKERLNLQQQTLDKFREQIKESTKLDDTRKKALLGSINETPESMAAKVADVEDIYPQRLLQEYNQGLILINKQQQIGVDTLKEFGETADQAYLRKKEGGIFEGMNSALKAMTSEVDMFAYNLGEKIPQMFADNMSQAISQMIEEGKSFGEVLQGAAYNFVKEINSAMIKNLATKTASSLGSFASGMFTSNAKASGGPITGGSGTKDDVPAMLMGGEYVINKKSVGKYGPQFLEAINNGTLGGYAQGGKVQSGKGGFFTPGTYGLGGIQGTGNLLKFATQGYTSGARDQIVNQGNYASINLEAESARLTNFGRSNSPQAEATRAAKEQAFGLYVQEIQTQEEARKQAEAQSDAFKKQLIMSAVLAAGSYAGGIAKTGFQQGIAGAAEGATTWQKFTAGLSGVGEKFGNVGSGLSSLFSGNMNQAGEYFSMANTNFASKIPTANIVDEVVKNISKSPNINMGVSPTRSYINTGATDDALLPTIGDFDNPIGISEYEDLNNLGNGILPPKPKKATGGSIPFNGGIDTVPAMLSGGEFIMNRSAAQNIGAGNLQALNAGAGTIVTEEKTEELNEKLIAKLDELIEASGGASSITINVEGSTGAATQSTNGNPTDQRQQMARQIKDAVLKILQDEKRLGGQLRR